MSTLVAEFSAWNNFDLTRAFTTAIQDVSAQVDFQIVDRRHLDADAHVRVELAVRSADLAVANEQACVDWLGEVVRRQALDVRLALGVAITGGATAFDAETLFNALGAPPPGTWREVRTAHGPAELYELIVRWLHHIIAARPAANRDLAQDSAQTIDENLPVSRTDQPSTLVIRQKP